MPDQLSQEEKALLILYRHEKAKDCSRRKLAKDDRIKQLMQELYQAKRKH